MPTYLKDLLDIPEQVNKGDFVLKLTEGISDEQAARTLETYVVTDSLAKNFLEATRFVGSAVQTDTSMAAYLHGSFGSGKSHFMAVLHLLLQGNATAREIPELAESVMESNKWTTSPDGKARKFLMVPYHMIGSRSMEQGILGGYSSYVRRTHPDAPIPGVYASEKMFEDANNLRENMGDAKFFEGLNRQTPGAAADKVDEWGDQVGAGWDAASYDAASTTEPGTPERSQLVGDLVEAYFSNYQSIAHGDDNAFLPLDDGLAVISQHAKALGYDAVILFLDELVLWLASHAADPNFVNREGTKLAKLVEFQNTQRPIPIITFVARQRDLRDLVDQNMVGAQRMNYADVLKHGEDRFSLITLEDRNLPAIAERRVLKVRDEAARQQLQTHFENTQRLRSDVLATLMTNEGDREMFRQVYPFSCALVTTLIDASSLLQRERTALRVLVQLLVRHRDELMLGDIVPVGDLFDVLAEGAEPFNDAMKAQLNNAIRLYKLKFLPRLEQEHGMHDHLMTLPIGHPQRQAFRNDDRLVKTLLLAALVTGSRPLRDLTARSLANLNHGSVKSPIPGGETARVIAKCRDWANTIGELKLGDDDRNPTVTLQLSNVDTDGIISNALNEDSTGNRRRLIRRMLQETLELDPTDDGMFPTHKFSWRGTERICSVRFENIHEMELSALTASNGSDGHWNLIIDYPFDTPPHTPRDDRAQMDKYREKHGTTHTLAWMPAFFSDSALGDLGRLVCIDHILASEQRFEACASHLAVADRAIAKSLLTNQQSQLRDTVRRHIEAAYGLRRDDQVAGALQPGWEQSDTFDTLCDGLQMRIPATANLKDALHDLLSQALAHQYPAHPIFEDAARSVNLRKVADETLAAAAERDNRRMVRPELRRLMKTIAEPLKLIKTAENAFTLSDHWKLHFTRRMADTGSETPTVSQLREWIDQPQLMGLPSEVSGLVILVFAAQTNRSFFGNGMAIREPTAANLSDGMELRLLPMPSEEQWEQATTRAASLFGIPKPPMLNARNMNALATEITDKLATRRRDAEALLQRLHQLGKDFNVPAEGSQRITTLSASLNLAEQLETEDSCELLTRLAEEPESQIGQLVRTRNLAYMQADKTLEAIRGTRLDMVQRLGAVQDDRRAAVESLNRDLAEALAADEHLTALAPVLKDIESRAVRLLTEVAPPISPPSTPPEPGPEPPQPVPPTKRVERISSGQLPPASLDEAEAKIAEIRQQAVEGDLVRIAITWTIDREKN